MKRSIALLLCVCMVLSLAACGKQSASMQELPQQTVQPVEAETAPSSYLERLSNENAGDEFVREDKELIAELIGGKDAASMSDTELDALVDQLIHDLEKDAAQTGVDKNQAVDQPSDDEEPHQNSEQKETPTIDTPPQSDAYDEEGAMTKPFDQVYPELIEEGKVSFSGESILVKLASGELTEGLANAGVGALEEIVPLAESAWYEAKLLEGVDAESALAAVRNLDEVLLAEYNYEVAVAALDDYKHFDKEKEEDFKKNGHNKDQWHFHYCGIPDGYEKMENAGGSSSVVVAVIDSGVDYNHEDLKDNMWVNAGEIPDNGIDDDGNGYADDYYGVDIIAGYGNGGDTNGHGTHVAGIIAADNNNTGVLGIAYNVKIMSVKAAMHNGTLNQADIAKAVLYAYENGAEVINMSFGGSACSIAVQDALATAYTRCVLVASAGNDGMKNEPTLTDLFYLPNYPAALTYVLGVMSVDETGRESVFTNYDVKAFNGVEYELYAPGENIMSTLPNNQYGFLSGTSMAAPMVSAFAAILRSEFTDRDMYPTKFIYGQLASTSGITADCLNPELHGKHNLPQIANLNDALTKLPKPEVGMQGYAIFDSVEIDPEHNNGDGVIDAGETIHLGVTLQNRWGRSENTLVTIDTRSLVGIEDPYITIENPTVDYGSVGTYSTQDCGRIFEDGIHTGWENPFVIKISHDCPNDYRLTFNVTVTCENALDPEDTTVYSKAGTIQEAVRSGYVLPAIIEEDMVLTADSLYIIPRATVITAGTTVRVEPGTQIQFWSDDPNDPYAEDGIAFLRVEGKFLVEGTKENPVRIFPSELMSNFIVDFGENGSGEIRLIYADITNKNYQHTNGNVSYAYGCTFRQNYGSGMNYRYMEGGTVLTGFFYDVNLGNFELAEKCVFYKLGCAAEGTTNYCHAQVRGKLDTCIFAYCDITFGEMYDVQIHNCVFLGNYLQDQTNPYVFANSSMKIPNSSITGSNLSSQFDIYYNAQNGSTYLTTYDDKDMDGYIRAYYEAIGIDFALIQNREELEWLVNALRLPDYADENRTYNLGITYDENQGKYLMADGSELPEFLCKDGITDSYTAEELYLSAEGLTANRRGSKYYLLEIPGQILPEDITFQEYTVDIDTETTYQIAPLSAPVQLPEDAFLYESTDEAVLTVSETGLVTPVSQGTADVWVWSLDKAVKNRVTVTVRDYVALDNLTLSREAEELAIGENLALGCTFSPANTTRKNVTFTSSDPGVATVTAGGVVTGVGSGSAIITASCEGLTATMSVQVFNKATSLILDKMTLSATLEDGAVALPQVITSPGAETDFSWRSTDEAVAQVKDGMLKIKSVGTTSIIVTDQRSGLSASCLVVISETDTVGIQSMQMNDSYRYVLLENGDVYHWNPERYMIPTRVATGIQEIETSGGCCLFLKEDGTLYHTSPWNSFNQYNNYDWFAGKEIVDLAYRNDEEAFFVVTADGNAYVWGNNNTYGQFGLGNNLPAESPQLINLEGVVDVFTKYEDTYFLTSSGDLYATGNVTNTNAPVKILSDVAKIYGNSEGGVFYSTTSGELGSCYKNGSSFSSSFYGKLDAESLNTLAQYGSTIAVIRDGKVFIGDMWRLDRLEEIPGISNAVCVDISNGTYYIATADGVLFGYGSNHIGNNAMAGMSTENPVTTPVLIPLQPLAEETIKIYTNLEGDVLVGNTLHLTFNKAINMAQPRLYADGMQITYHSEIVDYNGMNISRTNGFTEGVSYELVFAPNNIQAVGKVTNTQEIRIPFTWLPGEAEAPAPEAGEGTAPDAETKPEAPVVYEAIVDESIERVLTKAKLTEMFNEFLQKTGYNYRFAGNAILNPTNTDTNVSHWLRPQGGETSNYYEVLLGSNYWGTTNEKLIDKQIIDYADFPTYSRLLYAPYLTEAPENTFPFVTSVELINKYGESVTQVSNETITFRVRFNRDMDTSIPLLVRFGSAYPYGDYEIPGKYVDARTWEGTYTLNTLIENGYQIFSISNGCTATEDLDLMIDNCRFGFEIDTTAAQALIMQGTSTNTGIELKWTQDDFQTLMGYNVYRSESEDGYYTRLNTTVVPADTMSFFDDTVEPGKIYYYNFTVVQTDMSESEPSGKIVIMSKDTMAPNIYHSPVSSAFTGKNLILSATVTDNLNIAYANVYYRITGTDSWNTVRMSNLNDKYSAIIPASYVTVDGIEYYFEAFDGVSYTYKGSEEKPYTVQVQEAVDENSLGDVDGDGTITNRDALLLLYTINDKYNMTAAEFARADLNGDGELWAAEALQILRYVSGVIGSVKMS